MMFPNEQVADSRELAHIFLGDKEKAERGNSICPPFVNSSKAYV
jgi:hypothetical protein